MKILNYPITLNTSFWELSEKPVENCTIVQNISGRETGYRNNSKALMSYSFKVEYDKTEQTTFWNWFNNDLGQFSNAFKLSAIKQDAVFKFAEIPTPEDTDTQKRVLTFNIKEVM